MQTLSLEVPAILEMRAHVISAGEKARVVVAVDFGTTFSGFAYARTLEPQQVFTFFDWPCANKAGAKPYCKTQTSLFYLPSATANGLFDLKAWGWSGLHEFTQAALSSRAPESQANALLRQSAPSMSADLACSRSADDGQCNINALAFSAQELAEKAGFFATKFKLSLAPDAHNVKSDKLPGDLSVERMVSDYLRCLSHFIISELQIRYGKHFSMEDVQWCLTVPAIWDEQAKQTMKVCAEKAGMVKGAECPRFVSPSPYPLDIILEPEAASVYCQQKAKCVGDLKKGDKLLVADVGGGTIDLVVHEKADDDPKSMRVHEAVASYGDVGGGTFVDSQFFHFLAQKIGCFKEFCQRNTFVGVNIYAWCRQGVKMGFDGKGSAVMQLPRKLSEAWEKHDREHGIKWHDEDYYDEVRLDAAEIKAIFDPEVDKVVRLIEKHIRGARMLMLVGGFSASVYMRERIYSRFEKLVEEIIIPDDPGSAICHGAVQLHMHSDSIQSRIAKRTYGTDISRTAEVGDPVEHLYMEEGRRMCRCVFDAFVRAGERVSLNDAIHKKYVPSSYGQKVLDVSLYSSTRAYPKFITEAEVVKEGSFEVDMAEDMELEKKRSVEVSMCFGASLVQVSARRVNFGGRRISTQPPLSVKFCTQ